MYKCLYCNEVIENDEELLWGHIQMNHEDIFEDIQNWDTPYMIEECFEEC